MGKLSDAKLRGIKCTTYIHKFTDGDGLFLKVTPKGGMYWQWRIMTPTGETTVTYGSYPKVGLAEARPLPERDLCHELPSEDGR